MVLLQISDNSEYFLFEDWTHKKFVVCVLENKTKKVRPKPAGDGNAASRTGDKVQPSNVQNKESVRVNELQVIEFVVKYKVEWQNSRVLGQELNLFE